MAQEFFARVRAAFLAALERSAALRFFAAACACRERARWEAAECGSLFNLFLAARERAGEGVVLRPLAARFNSRCACLRTAVEVAPFFGGGSLMPARRALDKPMAMACLAERAPCSPSRMCSISSRTNSPAWVEADLPARLSWRARCRGSFSGIPIFSTGTAGADVTKRPKWRVLRLAARMPNETNCCRRNRSLDSCRPGQECG